MASVIQFLVCVVCIIALPVLVADRRSFVAYGCFADEIDAGQPEFGHIAHSVVADFHPDLDFVVLYSGTDVSAHVVDVEFNFDVSPANVQAVRQEISELSFAE